MANSRTSLSRVVIVLCRIVTMFVVVGALFIYVVLLSKYNKREDSLGQEFEGRSLYKYLPIGALSFSVVWNGFSLLSLGLRAAQWLSNRFRNAIDVFAAIELGALGYISFVYNLVTEWHGNQIVAEEKVLQIVALSLLSLAGAAHLLFFCYDCAASFFSPPLRHDEPESWLGQPPFSRNLDKPNPLTHGSQLSVESSVQRNSFLQRTESGRSMEMDMVVKPLALHRKSASASLHKKSNTFIRPVRPARSVDIPDYTPRGFVTRLANPDENQIQFDDAVSPILPVAPERSVSPGVQPIYPLRLERANRLSNSNLHSPVSPTLPSPVATRFPIKLSSRQHARSVSPIENEIGPRAGLSRSRSVNTPTPLNRSMAFEPRSASPPLPSYKLKRISPPPIEEHPAYHRDGPVTNLERRVTPRIPSPEPQSTAWGGNAYNDSQTFIPAYQEDGSAFGAMPSTPTKTKRFVFP